MLIKEKVRREERKQITLKREGRVKEYFFGVVAHSMQTVYFFQEPVGFFFRELCIFYFGEPVATQ